MEIFMGFLTILTFLLLVFAYGKRPRAWLLQRPVAARIEENLAAFESKADQHPWLLFFLLLILGILVRSYRFCELPRGQNQDGTMAAVEAYCLLHNGVDHWGHSWPTYFEAWGVAQMSTLYSYLMIPFVAVFGLTRFALRLPMLLVSVISLLILFDLVRRAMGMRAGLVALMIAAINPWQIVASRWALEANLMPHVILLAVYLLYLGRKRRVWLYASMVVFGLIPYAYGVGLFVAPTLLLLAAGYYVKERYVRLIDLVICILIFLIIAGPYIVTMAIQTFEWETIQLGPFTLPRFEQTVRQNDIALFTTNPYDTMLQNFGAFLEQFLVNSYGSEYNAVPWAHTMYPFAFLVFLSGLFVGWRRVRQLPDREQEGSKTLFYLMFIWLLAAVFNGLMVPGVVNRQNAVFYPLMLLTAFGILAAGKRLRIAAVGILSIFFVAFACFTHTYFTNTSYQNRVAYLFHEGLQEALTQTKTWDYDHYYVYATPVTALMFAHELDYAMLSEEIDLPDAQGEPSGWYFNDRYRLLSNWNEIELNPMDCAVYVFHRSEREHFNPEEYEITEFGYFCAAYPRYWLD